MMSDSCSERNAPAYIPPDTEVIFSKGTAVQGGASGSEHLTSFDYAYKLESVRDWLFAQSK
ncbi:MAG: hypothetical protein ACI4O4_10565 [Candidatus Ventricola sp.]